MQSTKFAHKDDVYRFLKEHNGEGLITASGPKWKADRKLITPLYTDKAISRFHVICVEQAHLLTDILKKNVGPKTFDVQRYVHRCGADIINESLLGVKTKAQEGCIDTVLEQIDQMYILVHSRIAKVWLQSDFIFKLLGYEKKQVWAKTVIYGFLKQCIEKARIKRHAMKDKSILDSGEGSDLSILDKLLELQANVPTFAVTEIDLIHHVMTLYTAAEDTVTVTTAFTLVCLGMYPETQDKVAQELLNVFGPTPKTVEREDLSKLVYLNMCVKEVLRLFPIAPFLVRKVTEDCAVDGYQIPKDCSVFISVFSVHRSEKHWERPDEFYPEHFLPEAVSKRHPFAYLPFSAGPRSCIGKSLAWMAISTMLATVLQNFSIEADGTLETRPIKSDITVRFRDGYGIRLKDRVYNE